MHKCLRIFFVVTVLLAFRGEAMKLFHVRGSDRYAQTYLSLLKDARQANKDKDRNRAAVLLDQAISSVPQGGARDHDEERKIIFGCMDEYHRLESERYKNEPWVLSVQAERKTSLERAQSGHFVVKLFHALLPMGMGKNYVPGGLLDPRIYQVHMNKAEEWLKRGDVARAMTHVVDARVTFDRDPKQERREELEDEVVRAYEDYQANMAFLDVKYDIFGATTSGDSLYDHMLLAMNNFLKEQRKPVLTSDERANFELEVRPLTRNLWTRANEKSVDEEAADQEFLKVVRHMLDTVGRTRWSNDEVYRSPRK